MHLQPGSVRVRRGAHVVAGQPLGKVGFSGDSLVPHLHYFVSSAPTYPMLGLPSYFDHFRRLLGSRSVAVARGQIDSGDIVESQRVKVKAE